MTDHLNHVIDNLRAVLAATPAPNNVWVRDLLDRSVEFRNALDLPDSNPDKRTAIEGVFVGIVMSILRNEAENARVRRQLQDLADA